MGSFRASGSQLVSCRASWVSEVRYWHWVMLWSAACGATHANAPSRDSELGSVDIVALSNGNCVIRDRRAWCWGLGGRDEEHLEVRPVCDVRAGDRLLAASNGVICFDRAAGTRRCCSVDGFGSVESSLSGPMRGSDSFVCSAESAGVTCALHGQQPSEVVGPPVLPGDTWSLGRLGDLCIHRRGAVGMDCILLSTRTRETRRAPIPWGDIELLAGGMLEGAATHGVDLLIWGSRTGGTLRTPIEWVPPAPVLQVAVGPSLGCALLEDGGVYCWGSNGCDWEPTRRPLDVVDNSCEAHDHAMPVARILPGVAISVVAGVRHACARLEDRTVWCWGSNYYGQLGDGTRVDSPEPVRSPAGDEVASD
jgi:hypothetical protein